MELWPSPAAAARLPGISSGAGATKTMQKRLEELRALPVDAILHKPYSAARILSAVASALAGKPSRLEKSPA
jgi:hypothetical protein